MTETMRLKLMEWIKDEDGDTSKYLAAAKEIGDDRAAGVLKDIADDEESHAKALDYILTKLS